MIEHFSHRIGDLEVRTCNLNLMQKGTHKTAEIVKWHKYDHKEEETCHTIASWKKYSDNEFEMHFTGKRPFYENPEEFFELARIGQTHLDDTE